MERSSRADGERDGRVGGRSEKSAEKKSRRGQASRSRSRDRSPHFRERNEKEERGEGGRTLHPSEREDSDGRERKRAEEDSLGKNGRGLLDSYGYEGQAAPHNGTFLDLFGSGLGRTFPAKKEVRKKPLARAPSPPLEPWKITPGFMRRTASRSPDDCRDATEESEERVPLFNAVGNWTPPPSGTAPGFGHLPPPPWTPFVKEEDLPEDDSQPENTQSAPDNPNHP